MMYALVTSTDAIERYQVFDVDPPLLAEAKGLRWLPVVDTLPTPGPGERLTGPTVVVGADAVARSWTVEPIPRDELAASLKSAVAAAVQSHLDATARARGYESIHTCVTYAEESSVARFQAEGRAARTWRSLVWAACYAALDDVLAGRREPLTPSQMVEELPPLVWPGD